MAKVALCPIYNNPEKRFQPEACGYKYKGQKLEHFPENIPSINVYWMIWKTSEKDENGQFKWKAGTVKECGFYVTDSYIKKNVEVGIWQITKIRGVIVLLDVITKKYPTIPLSDWKGYCMRCGKCCLQKRVATNKPCPYIQFVGEGLDINEQINFLRNKTPQIMIKDKYVDKTDYSNKINELQNVAKNLEDQRVSSVVKFEGGAGVTSSQSIVSHIDMRVMNKGIAGANKILKVKKDIEDHLSSNKSKSGDNK